MPDGRTGWRSEPGLVAGLLASLVMGGGFGIIGDIIIGILGAFVGAMALLFILRLIRGVSHRRH